MQDISCCGYRDYVLGELIAGCCHHCIKFDGMCRSKRSKMHAHLSNEICVQRLQLCKQVDSHLGDLCKLAQGQLQVLLQGTQMGRKDADCSATMMTAFGKVTLLSLPL